MAQHKSAKKRIRTSEKARQHNRAQRAMLRTAVKKVLTTTDAESGQTALRSATSLLDRMTARGLVHRNTAAHRKSRLTRLINGLGA